MGGNLANKGQIAATVLLAVVLGACKSQPIRKSPTFTYVAGPNQLTLLLDEGTFRFAYDTDNQFRAERRFPNGTVAGYFGYIGADGKAVRVKYGSVDELGFTAIQELIPDAFPESLTEEPPTTDASAALPEAPSASDAAFGLLTQPYEPVVDDARESVSVDAIEYYEARRKADPSSSGKWSFPLIEDDELPKKRTSRSVESEPYRRLFRQGLVLEQHPGEPAIIYADPDANDQLEDRYLKTARAQITLE